MELHTKKEIIYFYRLQSLAIELKKLGYAYDNEELKNLSDKYQAQIELELTKYYQFIGTVCTCPDSTIVPTGSRREGHISGNFYFHSKSVMCDFKYKSGGFDTHAISELIEISE